LRRDDAMMECLLQSWPYVTAPKCLWQQWKCLLVLRMTTLLGDPGTTNYSYFLSFMKNFFIAMARPTLLLFYSVYRAIGAQLVKLSNIQWTLMHLSRPTNWLIGFIQTISLSQIRIRVHGGSDSKYEKKKVPETTATYRYFCHDVRISFILQFFDWYVSKND
jgi:hypothetical protein